MRKWICLGVLGGLLEFGIVYQVAFSEVDAPPPEALKAQDNANRQRSSRSASGAAGAPARPSVKAAEVDPVATATTPGATVPAAKVSASPSAGVPAAGRSVAEPAGSQAAKAVDLASLLTDASSVVAEIAAATLAASPAPAPVDPAAAASDTGTVAPPPVPPSLPAPAGDVPAAKTKDLSKLPVEDMIREVFGPHGDKAVEVARCESTLRPHAKSGQYLGLFQMGANERADYGHGSDPLTQVEAAYALFLSRGWQPWTCA